MYVGSLLCKSDGSVASVTSLVDGDEVVTLRYALARGVYLIIAYYLFLVAKLLTLKPYKEIVSLLLYFQHRLCKWPLMLDHCLLFCSPAPIVPHSFGHKLRDCFLATLGGKKLGKTPNQRSSCSSPWSSFYQLRNLPRPKLAWISYIQAKRREDLKEARINPRQRKWHGYGG